MCRASACFAWSYVHSRALPEVDVLNRPVLLADVGTLRRVLLVVSRPYVTNGLAQSARVRHDLRGASAPLGGQTIPHRDHHIAVLGDVKTGLFVCLVATRRGRHLNNLDRTLRD